MNCYTFPNNPCRGLLTMRPIKRINLGLNKKYIYVAKKDDKTITGGVKAVSDKIEAKIATLRADINKKDIHESNGWIVTRETRE